jgi:hypothetical protein
MTLVTETTRIEEAYIVRPGDVCDCESHKYIADPYGGSNLKRGRIHNYTYKPRPWKMKTVRDDPFDYFLGVELETDNYVARGMDRYGRFLDTTRSQISNHVAVDMRRPKNLWFAKSDASVSGPEFVSQPATYAFWEKNKAGIGEMFKMLLHAGFRSYDNDKAGMHINISNNAFDDDKHLYRFLTLVHFSPVWARRMAQRTQESMDHWAKVDLGDQFSDWSGNRKDVRRQLAKWAKMDWNEPVWSEPRRYVSAHYDDAGVWHPSTWTGGVLNPNYTERPNVGRYTALNVMKDRTEFRLPRGTLRLDRFFKNLQWTVSMIEFTRIAGVLDARPAAYMDYAAAHATEYPDLAAFLRERAPKLQRALAR